MIPARHAIERDIDSRSIDLASGPRVVVQSVDRLASEDDRLLGWSIDRPAAGDNWHGTTLPVAGWVLGREVPAVAVDFIHQGRVIRKAALDMERDDVSARFEGQPVRRRCGFRTSVGMLGLASPCEIELRAVFDDGAIRSLGRLSVTHAPLRSDYPPRWAPLALTTLGRTGSTWMMRLLREHPEIAVHGGYPYETRAAAYWLHMIRVLSTPANRLQSSHPDAFPDDLWAIGHHPFNGERLATEPELQDWFRADYPAHVMGLAQRSIDEFYDRVAKGTGKPDARTLAEKFTPGLLPRLMWETYPDAGEIVLVRDFRDMACSILAFNAKRGFVAFGRENVASDAEFIESNLASGARSLLADWRERSRQARLVRYEDLVCEPEATLSKLCAGLGLADDSGTIGKLIERASGTSGEMDRHRTSRDPRASIGRWRSELAPHLVEACREAFGEALDAFGYDVD